MNSTRNVTLITAILGGFLAVPASYGAAFGPTVGIYDENTSNTNAVDVNLVDLATFSGAVATAFAADTGGVIDFKQGGLGGSLGQIHSATYGASETNIFNFTTSQSTQFVTGTGSFLPISGVNGFTQISDQTSQLFTFNADGDGAVSDAPLVSQIGFTLLSRANAAYPLDVLATATYTDSSTQAVTSTLSNVKGATDTFVSFLAPLGEGISTLNLQSFQTGTTTPVSTRIAIDDLGFITIPEPASLTLLLAGGTLLLARRRKTA